MENSLRKSAEKAVKNWWMPLVLGILFIVFGVWILWTPASSYVALSIVFIAFLVVTGLMEIIFSIANSSRLKGWGWYMIGGLFDLAAGVVLLYYPGLSLVVLPVILAVWLMFRGFAAMGASTTMQRLSVKGWGWTLFWGILAVICSIVVLFNPVLGGFAVIWIVSFGAIFFGVGRIMLAFDLKKLK